jgi:hypothetical protein
VPYWHDHRSETIGGHEKGGQIRDGAAAPQNVAQGGQNHIGKGHEERSASVRQAGVRGGVLEQVSKNVLKDCSN